MNISNASCEYFYDEEYDVAINEGTYNQPFLSSFNNNYYPFVNGKNNNINEFNRDYLTTSRLWSECLLEKSENNNIHESNDLLQSTIYKCKSSDDVIDASQYSLSHDVPFLNQTVDNSFNYRLYFEKRDLIDSKGNFDIRKQFAKRHSSKNFIDSGKCSAATSDSLIHPFKHYRNELANSENNLNETSVEDFREIKVTSHRKKSSKQVWRKLKSVFALKTIKWKKIVSNSTSIRFSRSYSVPCLSNSYAFSDVGCNRTNRYSTTVVELYNLLTDLTNDYNDSVFVEKDSHSQCVQTAIIPKHDVDCQFPESYKGIRQRVSRPRSNAPAVYPGLGKIKLPHELRTSIHHLLNTDNDFTNLKFLENIPEAQTGRIKRSSSTNPVRGRYPKCSDPNKSDGRKKCNILTRCASESRHHHDSTNINDDCSATMTCNPLELMIMEESKSVSSCDLRPIPRRWGLGTDDNITAIFDLPSRGSVPGQTMVYEQENCNRIGGLVTTTISAIKALSASVSSSQHLATMCDRFIKCKEAHNRLSCPALLMAVDSVVSLMSDGLYLDSVRGKTHSPDIVITSKITMRMWMFIEESCRSSLIKDASQKLVFANLLKQVKQVCTGGGGRSKESLALLKLHLFIVIALKTNILHIWLRSIVVNDTILHRFFSSDSFFQQARTTYSNALSAVVVELRRLSSIGVSKVSTHISKPLKGKAIRPSPRPSEPYRQISTSSSDHSISKSRIPRPTKPGPAIVVVK